jgi:serine/threonine-protein kinase
VSETLRGATFSPEDAGTGIDVAVLFYRREFDEVLRTAGSVLAEEKNLPPFVIALLHAARANAHLAKGEKELASSLYEQAERELKELRDKGDESLFLLDNLIDVEARLGRREEVQRQANALIRRTQKDQWRYPQTEDVLARAYVALGDVDRAFPLLEHALAAPGENSLTTAILRLDPTFDPIRNDPRFKKLSEQKQPAL